jgi:hypothetical protein
MDRMTREKIVSLLENYSDILKTARKEDMEAVKRYRLAKELSDIEEMIELMKDE